MTGDPNGRCRTPRTGQLIAIASLVLVVAYAVLSTSASHLSANGRAPLPVGAVDTIGMTVSDMDRAVAFYTGTLSFSTVSEHEVSGRPYELLSGLFGARSRIVRLRLGSETIELTEFVAPKGRPIPGDVRANDRVFQHIAIVVRDITKAYDVLRARHVEHASTGPQRLPD
jgi:catechol 2,3-dioxygenase-like lactoylglutathione lyase family enzyme